MLLGLPRGDARSSPDPRCGPRRSTHTTSTSTECPWRRALCTASSSTTTSFPAWIPRWIVVFSLSPRARAKPSSRSPRPCASAAQFHDAHYRHARFQRARKTERHEHAYCNPDGRALTIWPITADYESEPDRPPRIAMIASGAAVRVGLICGAPTTSDALHYPPRRSCRSGDHRVRPSGARGLTLVAGERSIMRGWMRGPEGRGARRRGPFPVVAPACSSSTASFARPLHPSCLRPVRAACTQTSRRPRRAEQG